MNPQLQKIEMIETYIETANSAWKSLYKVGGLAVLGTFLVALVEMGITFLPGGNTPYKTIFDWFSLFQNNPFMGLRNLGLLNILFCLLDIPIFFALFGAHRKTSHTIAGMAMMISFIGVAVFYATNRAFAMLDLSHQYTLATTEAQRSILAAAGQAMLSVGQSHTPGTFIAFFLSEVAGLLISVVMLRDKIFNRANAILGILAFSSMLVFEVSTSFVPTLHNAAMILVMAGGVLNLAWEILVALKLFQLGK